MNFDIISRFQIILFWKNGFYISICSALKLIVWSFAILKRKFKNYERISKISWNWENLLLLLVQVVLCLLTLDLVLQRFFDLILTFWLVFVISHLEVHYQPIFCLHGFSEIPKNEIYHQLFNVKNRKIIKNGLSKLVEFSLYIYMRQNKMSNWFHVKSQWQESSVRIAEVYSY